MRESSLLRSRTTGVVIARDTVNGKESFRVNGDYVAPSLMSSSHG